MGFKKIAVLADVYEMSKSKVIGVHNKVGEPLLVDRIFSLTDANNRNLEYKNKRRWIEIKWEETAILQLEAGNLDWVEYALNIKNLECKALKRKIKFPVKDDYREALRDGEELDGGYNDYIGVVEDHIDILSGIVFEAKPTDEEVKEAKLAKALKLKEAKLAKAAAAKS